MNVLMVKVEKQIIKLMDESESQEISETFIKTLVNRREKISEFERKYIEGWILLLD